MPNLHVHSPFSIFNSQLLHPCVNPAIPGKINAVMKMKLQTPAVFALGAAGYAALELLWRGRTHWTMALTGGAFWSVCGSCGGAYTRKTRSPAACAARRASRPRNMWSAVRSTGISGCACGITRTNSAMFKDRSARNTPCCGRCSPRRSCCRNKTKMCASPLAIRFSMAYNSDKLCRKGDTPC